MMSIHESFELNCLVRQSVNRASLKQAVKCLQEEERSDPVSFAALLERAFEEMQIDPQRYAIFLKLFAERLVSTKPEILDTFNALSPKVQRILYACFPFCKQPLSPEIIRIE
ncbi:MAG: hypothetical protein KDK65_00795 [Chlamydiia bacterium]|nr:hypothetical protein [Chlamydiia bacterium]